MATAKLSFRIFKNGQLVRETQLNQGVIKIGKLPSAHLYIDDEHASRMHAIIEVLGNEVSVIDLGSTGGTFVNGQRINKAKLQSGDVITVGESRIEIAIGEPLVSAPVPPEIPVRLAPALAAMPAVTVTLPATPPPAAAVTRTAAKPAIFTTAMAGEVDDGGARAVEVAAMLGDSVVGVKHCMDPHGGKVTPATWGFLAGGVACLLASATAFYTSVDTAARNKGALGVHLSMGKPERAFRPKLVSPGVDVVAFGGLAAGLVGITAALARIRRERRSPFYRIGTAPEVEQPIENAPAASFPLVAPSGDDFVFNYGHGIDGELIVDGKSTPLAELAAQGRSRPSPTTAGAIEVPIPFAARIRARAGQTTFLVTAVAKPRAATAPLFNLERRTLAYGAGSLAVHLGIVAFLGTVPLDDAGVNVDLMFDAMAKLEGRNTMTEDPVQEPEKPTDNGKQNGSSVPTTAMALDEGMAGKPSAVRTDGNMEVKNNNADPQFSRQQAVEYARTAGVLGSESAIRGGIAALTANTDFSSGWSDADIYGPLFGSEGEGRGNFGMGRKDWGSGGGCMQEPCGTVGVKWGRIAIDTRPGDNWGGPGGSWGRQRTHTPQVPPPTFSMPSAIGGLDKAIIKRYIKRSVHKIAYCYESELLARPGIEGQVMVSFMITSSGTVQSSAGNGFDAKVSSCVAGVIKNIEFPRPTDGGNVQVNYPFTFHATGK